MASKYPSLSPYTYCAKNPIKLVDPNGEDIWEINEEGRIVNHDNSYTEKDVFYKVDKNGKRIEGESIEFAYGTIEQQKSISYSPDGKNKDTYDMYQVWGDDNSHPLSKFASEADMNLKSLANDILKKSGKKCPQYNIYHIPSKSYIPY